MKELLLSNPIGGGEIIQAQITVGTNESGIGYVLDAIGSCTNPVITMVATTNENSAFGVVTFVSMTSDILQLTITRLDTGLTISGSNQDGSQKQGIISEQIFFTEQDVGLTIPIEITNIIYA